MSVACAHTHNWNGIPIDLVVITPPSVKRRRHEDTLSPEINDARSADDMEVRSVACCRCTNYDSHDDARAEARSDG